MAVIIETRGNLAPVYPGNGRTFSIDELIELMGPQLSIYELECATPENLHDRAHYIVTIRNVQENGLDRNETASNIYASSMKGLVGGSVYGRVLVCKLAELEPKEIPEAAYGVLWLETAAQEKKESYEFGAENDFRANPAERRAPAGEKRGVWGAFGSHAFGRK